MMRWMKCSSDVPPMKGVLDWNTSDEALDESLDEVKREFVVEK